MKVLAHLILLLAVAAGSILGYRTWMASRPQPPAPSEIQADRLRDRVRDLEAQTQGAALRETELQGRIGALETQVKTAEETARQAQRLNTPLRAEIESMVVRHLESTRAQHDLTTQTEALRARVATLQEQIQAQRSLADQLSAAEEAQKTLAQQLQAAQAETQSVRRDLARSQTATQAADQRARRLEEMEATLRQQVQALQARIKTLEEQVKTQQTEVPAPSASSPEG